MRRSDVCVHYKPSSVDKNSQQTLMRHTSANQNPVSSLTPPCGQTPALHVVVLLWTYLAGGAGEVFLQEQQSIDPPSTARQEAAQPRYRPVPSSNLQHQHTQGWQQEVTHTHTHITAWRRCVCDPPDSSVQRVVEVLDDSGGVPGDCGQSEDP